MYIVWAVIVVFVAGLLFLLARMHRAVQQGRKRRVIGQRLAVVVAQAEEADRQRRAARHAGDALTALLPAIQAAKDGPRRVA